jgi:1-deoxy-D-xylulose-5-phosphate reductoisomerase
MVKTVTILGATGSIGDSTLHVLRQHPDKFRLKAITAHSNAEKLAAIAKEFNVEFSATCAQSENAAIEAAQVESDIVVSAIVGIAGLKPTMAAIERGATIALANKESLVCAGELMTKRAAQTGAKLIPVDSEHSAIYQVFDFAAPERIERITLTASGGPFRQFSAEQLKTVTPKQAVAHPNWDMGAKISVDSATMMNKGLELIEALHMFNLTPDKLGVLVHPESIIHSLVHYCDGSVLAQASEPDMCVPIAYALGIAAKQGRLCVDAQRLNLAQIGRLTFEEPDFARFPCLKIAIDSMIAGGAAPIVLNAANEIAVAKFLRNEIAFTQIAQYVSDALGKHNLATPQSLDDVFAIDAAVRV